MQQINLAKMRNHGLNLVDRGKVGASMSPRPVIQNEPGSAGDPLVPVQDLKEEGDERQT